jgi:hypothetical protein
MKYVNEVKKNDKGYVIHNREIVEVTVRDIVDISYHGSSYDVIYVKEISSSDETFRELYDLTEAKELLLKYLESDLNKLKHNKEEIKSNIKDFKRKIKKLKGEL